MRTNVLHTKKHLNVLNVMLNSEEGIDELEFAAAKFHEVCPTSSSSSSSSSPSSLSFSLRLVSQRTSAEETPTLTPKIALYCLTR